MNKLSRFTAFMMLVFLVQLGHAQIIDQSQYEALQRKTLTIEGNMPNLERTLLRDKQRLSQMNPRAGSSQDDIFQIMQKNYDAAALKVANKKATLLQYKQQTTAYEQHLKIQARNNNIINLNSKIDATLATLSRKGVSTTSPQRPDDVAALERIERSLEGKLIEVERKEQEAAQLAQLQQSIAEKNQKLESLGTNPHRTTSVNEIASAKSYNDKLESDVANAVTINAEEDRISDERTETVIKYLSMILFLFVTFCVVYSAVKGLGRTAVVFADYTDLTLTFVSIIGLPFVIIMANAIVTDDHGVIPILLIAIQFVVIQGVSTRNLYHLNGGNTMTTIFVAVGRMVLCIGLLSMIADLFKKNRSFYSQILTLIFSILLGKLILRIVARNEFTPLGQFFTKTKFVNEYDDQFLTEYRQPSTAN